ncbi:tetratricopeptide repeat protein [Pseudomonas sp. MS19]|uniref:tetratricopeptide repeat protein n=1 Tax=Pseudomonas sp. MS19 TaxID=2579939 RepID=UPI0015624304|nr:tetratricopeptide repeat protein [Pseudomonas sp. MS19]NRH26315.1 sel1 repeat family protein [Pseudomonas sp. MS19]
MKYATGPLAKLAALVAALLIVAGCSSKGDQPQTPETPTTGDAPATQQMNEYEQLQMRAKQGDINSQFQLGSSYFVGKPVKDLKQAEYWWKQAADKGQSMAAVSLAYLYTGRDDPAMANQKEMLKYLNQSAAANNPMAQHILGTLYLKGDFGVPRDPTQAKALFQSACNSRYSESCETLKKLP